MVALSCQVIGNVGSSTMCFLLEVPSPNSSVSFYLLSLSHVLRTFRDSIFALSCFVATVWVKVWSRHQLTLLPCMIELMLPSRGSTIT